jgi:hypothetical protein
VSLSGILSGYSRGTTDGLTPASRRQWKSIGNTGNTRECLPAPTGCTDLALKKDSYPTARYPKTRAQRIAYVVRCLRSSNPNMRNSRAFDSCFEMHDGDAVAVGVYRKIGEEAFTVLDREKVMALVAKEEALAASQPSLFNQQPILVRGEGENQV